MPYQLKLVLEMLTLPTQPWLSDQLPDLTLGLVPAVLQPAQSWIKSKKWHSLHILLPA